MIEPELYSGLSVDCTIPKGIYMDIYQTSWGVVPFSMEPLFFRLCTAFFHAAD